MNTQEIIERYNRGLSTHKRRLIIRSIMTLTILTIAVLKFLDIAFYTDLLIAFYILLSIFFIYSYSIGRRVGAVKDFKAIAEYYMQEDKQIPDSIKSKILEKHN